ncbi:MAG: Rne/Rng family ribonuclease [Pseudomonadota bacterium]|nr:Rne/Rng family ribonuclease [Pseudomonadota bacterium]
MGQQLFINSTDAEVRAALMDDGALIDLIIERRERASLVGNIYLGRVERLMKGMEAAFVNVGLSRSGFLGLDDGRRHTGDPATPVNEGETVMVQITKDAIDGKGVQLSRRVTLPGRYLVYAPNHDRVMVSRQIADEGERDRLTGLMVDIAVEGEGFILRTAAVGATADELQSDSEQLRETWLSIEQMQSTGKAPSCVHADLDPVLRVLRDYALDDIAAVHVDDGDAAEAAKKFCEKVMPGMAERVKLHNGRQQMFEQFGIEEEIERACVQRVDLISGGSLMVQTAEALTAIDVNSSRFDGASDLEQMAFRTNCEAASEAARQIRVRNISGLIVIDFIHMENDDNWERILDILEEVAGRDRNATRVLGVTEAGLVEITRRRRREPLLHTMTEICETCDGVGRIRSVDAVSIDILRALQREAHVTSPGELVLYAQRDVVNSLENGFGGLVDDIEDATGRTIVLRADEEYARDSYDIVVE